MANTLYKGGDPLFLKACELGQTPATKRQFKKFTKQKRGKAWEKREEAKKELNKEF